MWNTKKRLTKRQGNGEMPGWFLLYANLLLTNNPDSFFEILDPSVLTPIVRVSCSCHSTTAYSFLNFNSFCVHQQTKVI